MEAPKPSTEPVIYAGFALMLATTIAGFLQKYGVTIDPAALSSILCALIAAAIYWARKRVHPAVKVQEQIADAHARGMAIGAARASQRPTVDTTPPLGAA